MRKVKQTMAASLLAVSMVAGAYPAEQIPVVAEAATQDVITLNATSLMNWPVGKTGNFYAYVNGTRVNNATLNWSSSNPSVATCENGVLTAVGAGTAIITCTKENAVAATCTVTVKGNDIVTLNATSLTNWSVGKSGNFYAYVNGKRVSNSTMTWSSSDTSVATCENGVLTAVGAGTAVISCTRPNATTATCTVTVKGNDIVTLNATSLTNWSVGKSGNFYAYVNGKRVSNSTMTWSSSDTSVATCENGVLTAKGPGTAIISCTRPNATTATCTVTVKGNDIVTLNVSELKDWKVGKTGTFYAYVNGRRVANNTMTWSSSNNAVATCENGVLTAKGPGTAVITCTKANATVASCTVTVKGNDIVTLNVSELKDWKVGKTGTFYVYVNGRRVSNSTMTWSSSNTAVATCENGVLTAKGPGTAIISCTKAGATTATCTVTVKASTTERNLGGVELIIGDHWSTDEPYYDPDNPRDVATQRYREEIFAKYNFTMERKCVASWGEMQWLLEDSVASGEPAAQLFDLDYRFVAEPMRKGCFYDLATLDELNFSEEKWNKSITSLMTRGNSIYGMRAEKSEPRGGVIWNKRLFEEAGIDPNLPYDLQASGQWTWSVFEELCEKLTRDIDNDGVVDIYATLSFGADTMTCLVASAGSDFIVKDANGNLVNNMGSPEVLNALNFAVDLYNKGYEMPIPNDADWDFHITAFEECKAAMQFNEEYFCQPGLYYGDMEDELGFVMPPKPDGAASYHSYVSDNIVIIPSCYDEETASIIAFAYNLYTMATPGYEDPDGWKDIYYSHFDDTRAVDETIAKFNDGTSVHYLNHALVPRDLGPDLLWWYPFGDTTPAERVAEIKDSWDELLDDLNNGY